MFEQRKKQEQGKEQRNEQVKEQKDEQTLESKETISMLYGSKLVRSMNISGPLYKKS